MTDSTRKAVITADGELKLRDEEGNAGGQGVELMKERYWGTDHKSYRALRDRQLAVETRAMGQLGRAGEQYLHFIISHCSNYNYRITQSQIEKKKASPMGCRRIHEIMGEALNGIECRCALEIPPGGYASPMLHVYANATKNLGGRKGR